MIKIEEKNHYVYIHTFPNGKKYIGITRKEPTRRWQNGKGYDKLHQSCMYNAIQKYGWENVKSEIVAEKLTLKQAQDMEIELIKKYHTFKGWEKSNGYNMTLGGEGTHGHKGSELISKTNRDKLLGKRGYDCCNSIPVICENKEYPSITDFCEKNNILYQDNSANTGLVVPWLKGKKAMPKEWYEKGLKYKDSNFITKPQEKPHTNSIFYDGMEFKSQRRCADYIGVSPSALCLWLSGKNSIPKEIAEKGLFYKNKESGEIQLKDRIPMEEKQIYNAKKVFCYGVVYNSYSELERNTKFKAGTVRAWLVGKNKIPKEHQGNIYHI